MPIAPQLKVIPVLDLLSGQVVRALRGERSAYRPIVSPLAPGSDPVPLAEALLQRCASTVLYVADLDAIQGRPAQHGELRELLAALPGVTLWVDGGFADVAAAMRLRDAVGAGADRLRAVYGSESIASAAALQQVAAQPQAVLSLDCRHARAIDRAGCWSEVACWPHTMIVMTLDRVGTGSGPDLALFEQLRARAPDRQWFGAGGIRSRADLQAAQAAGAEGWLVASALHDGALEAAPGTPKSEPAGEMN